MSGKQALAEALKKYQPLTLKSSKSGKEVEEAHFGSSVTEQVNGVEVQLSNDKIDALLALVFGETMRK
uniref:Uncharacterized protein n=1 Tax=Cucumis melo TaxID=3656 RepID=A0A9I9DWU5_CUCME